MRGRLIVAFAAVTVLGTTAAVWAVVQQSTTSLIEAHQRYSADDLVSRVTEVAPTVQYPPNQDALDQLRVAAGENTLVRFQDMTSGDGVFVSGTKSVPADLREAMRARESADAETASRVLTQRADIDGSPWLVIGAPVMITTAPGKQKPSGIEVYAARDLSLVRDQVGELIRGGVTTTLLVLPLAVLLALLASRGVLRPVARLRFTAQRLAIGDLEARTEPTGVDELAQLTRTVNDMAASLQDSMDSMARMEEGARRFAADVSHELRTPLTTMTAAVEVLRDVLSHAEESGELDEDARESAQLAVVETRRLVGLVEDIMEIARFDAGTVHLDWGRIDLVEVIDACMRNRGWSDDVVIVLPPAFATRDGTVAADRRRVDVIMANLVGNALRHGSVPVRVEITTTDDGVAVRVVDSGPGIPADVLPHVFSRFFKADASRTRTPGSGLGLAIARENAILHGGTITVANRPRAGAVFTLWLPRSGVGAAGLTGDEEEQT